MGSQHQFLKQVPMLLIVIAGCGSDSSQVAPVNGTVTLQGEPLAGASVIFVPKNGGRPSTAETDDQGKFRLTTFHQFDGALVGEHFVTVTKIENNSDMPRAPAAAPQAGEDPSADEVPLANVPRAKIKWLVPEQYSDPNTSGLSATVKAGKNEFPLSLK